MNTSYSAIINSTFFKLPSTIPEIRKEEERLNAPTASNEIISPLFSGFEKVLCINLLKQHNELNSHLPPLQLDNYCHTPGDYIEYALSRATTHVIEQMFLRRLPERMQKEEFVSLDNPKILEKKLLYV